MRCATLLMGVSWVAPATAATLHVPEEFESIAWALEYAYDGDTIEVDGAYYDGEETIFVYDVDVTIKGVGDAPPILPAIVATYSGLELENVVLGGLPYYDTYSGAVARLLVSDGYLHVRDVTVWPVDDDGTAYAFGIYADYLDAYGFQADNLSIDSWGYGAAVAVNGSYGKVIIDNSSIQSSMGQGVIVQDVGNVHISGSTFAGNMNTAVYAVDTDQLVIDGNTVFQYNQGDYGADVLMTSSTDSYSWGSLDIANSTFSGSSANYLGGSIYASYADVTISQVAFSAVSATSGGALAVFGTETDDAMVDLSHVTVEGGSVTSSGGAFAGSYVNALITDSSFDDLDAQAGGESSVGGAIALWAASLDMQQVSFLGNSADYGGSYYLSDGTLKAVDVSVGQTGSHKPVSGGGAYLIDVSGAFEGGSFDDLATSSGAAAVLFSNANLGFTGTTFDNMDTGGSGTIAGLGGALTLSDVEMTDLNAASAAALMLTGVTTMVDGLAVSRAHATGSAAGVLAQDGYTELLSYSVMDSSANQTTAGLFNGGTVIVRDSTFKRNTAAQLSSAFGLQGMDSIEVQTSLFCNNGGAGYDVITVVGTGEFASIHNNIFHMNDGPGADIRVAYADGYPVATPLSVINNTFANGTQALGAVSVLTGSAAITNNIFQGGLIGVSTDGAEVSGGYNLWWDNEQDAVGTDFNYVDGDVFEDAMFVNVTEDCFSDLHLQPDSPARGAGDPDLYGDGLGWDLGRWTGPPVDSDQDGYTSDIDCDDNDPGRHPGAVDTIGDGIDQDCDGIDVSLFVTGGGGGCGCASSPVSAGWLLGLLPLMLVRRRG
jgi:hypothetical protein